MTGGGKAKDNKATAKRFLSPILKALKSVDPLVAPLTVRASKQVENWHKLTPSQIKEPSLKDLLSIVTHLTTAKEHKEKGIQHGRMCIECNEATDPETLAEAMRANFTRPT